MGVIRRRRRRRKFGQVILLLAAVSAFYAAAPGAAPAASAAALTRAPADAPSGATGALSTVSSVTVNGGYAAAGIGMRNLGYGTISVTGVPAGAAVRPATLLWDVLANDAAPAFAQGVFNGTAITGTAWASGGSPCWPVTGNFSYEADVTSLVTGNGSYSLSAFASGESDGADPFTSGSTPPMLEGASLVVVYSLASMAQTTIQIGEGATETDSGDAATATLTGFTASASPAASTTYIVADGQDGDSTASLSVTGNGDCLVWVGQVLSVPGSPAYVALGDSYSSGEGDGAYLTGSDTATDHCHRSSNAYPELADQDAHLGSLDFVSCSGAITDDFFDANDEGNNEPPQSQALTSGTKYVTLTFGGNDLGFGAVLAQCIYGKYGPVTVYGKEGCAKDKALTKTVADRLSALAGQGAAKTPGGVTIHPIASILRRIHALAPNAKIYLADYPLLFGSKFSGACGVGTVVAHNVPIIGHVTVALKISKEDAVWLNSVGRSLAGVLRAAAAANGATFVDAEPDFRAHVFCDTAASWIAPLSGTYNYKTKKLTYDQGAFHPTPTGQKSGYEAAFVAAGL